MVEFLQFDMQGKDREDLIKACNRALNICYFSLMLVAVPISVVKHLIIYRDVYGFLYLAGPAIYLPAALGWFPRSAEARVLLASIIMLMLALSINSLYDWRVQPGLYVLTIPVMALFATYGTGGLLVSALVVCLVTGIPGYLSGWGIDNVVISLGVWLGIAVAGCSIFTVVITHAYERAVQLEATNAQLLQREQDVAGFNESMRQFYGTAAHDLRTPASAIHMLVSEGEVTPTLKSEVKDQADRLLETLDTLNVMVEEFGASSAGPGIPGRKDALSSRAIPASVPASRGLVGKRILLIEDDRTLARMTTRLLRSHFGAASVAIADDGDMASTLLASERAFDVLVVDYLVPGIEGDELIRRVRASGSDLPIIAVTAAALGSKHELLLEAGADAVLQKPLTIVSLSDAIDRLASGRLKIED